jgi:hypothetical protein
MKIFCIGDCHTSGYDPDPKNRPQGFLSYPIFLQEILGKEKAEVINMGRSMMTLSVLGSYPNVTIPQEACKDDIILLWCGQNDMALEKSADETFSLYLQYYEKFKKQGLSDSIIHLTCMPRLNINDKKDSAKLFEKERVLFNSLLLFRFPEKSIDIGNNKELIDQGELREDYATLFPALRRRDHLNREGNKKVAKIIAEYLSKNFIN